MGVIIAIGIPFYNVQCICIHYTQLHIVYVYITLTLGIFVFIKGPFVPIDSAHFLPPMDGPMTSDPMSPPPEGEGLRATLVRQLEYYFSKENLSSDKYLCK